MQQCWEHMKCGKTATCQAAIQKAGRKCWLAAGTLCGGAVQGTTAQKIGNCKACTFYKSVKG